MISLKYVKCINVSNWHCTVGISTRSDSTLIIANIWNKKFRYCKRPNLIFRAHCLSHGNDLWRTYSYRISWSAQLLHGWCTGHLRHTIINWRDILLLVYIAQCPMSHNLSHFLCQLHPVTIRINMELHLQFSHFVGERKVLVLVTLTLISHALCQNLSMQ